MSTYTITETIHHGDYVNVQTSEPKDRLYDAVLDVLDGSPYYSAVNVDQLFGRFFAPNMELITDTPVEFGWGDYTLTITD